MKITIKKQETIKSDHVRRAAHFFARKMIRPHVSLSIKLQIQLVPDLYKKEKIQADCEHVEERNVLEGELYHKFIIRLDASMKIYWVLLALAHEMVHVKQYAHREMREELCGTITTFFGKAYRHNDADLDEYYDSPWEIEAHGRELGLLNRYIAHFKLKDQDAFKAAHAY